MMLDDYEVPIPGKFISEELEARGWSQRDLAFILGIEEPALNKIIRGKTGVSVEMSKQLGKAFEIDSDFFSNLQKAYDFAHTRDPDPAIERRAVLQRQHPLREMIRRKWIADMDIGLIEAQLMRFFRKNDLSEITPLAFAAKKRDYSETTNIQLAWLYRVHHIAAEMVVPEFSDKKLAALLDMLPRYTLDPEEVRHVPRALSECGIRYIIVETLPKADIDGVCFWLDEKKPVIGMTTRHDRIDNFWFVLRHELEHVRNKDGRGELNVDNVDMDLEGERAGVGENLPLPERKANQAAANFCVPESELDTFYMRKFPFISERDVLGFAGRVLRHPGIVVGQLQKKMNRYDWLARYKVKIRQYLIGNAVMDGWGTPIEIAL